MRESSYCMRDGVKVETQSKISPFCAFISLVERQQIGIRHGSGFSEEVFGERR